MYARYILAALAVAFISAAAWRHTRPGAARAAQTRTWLMIGVIFALVSAWLFYRG